LYREAALPHKSCCQLWDIEHVRPRHFPAALPCDVVEKHHEPNHYPFGDEDDHVPMLQYQPHLDRDVEELSFHQTKVDSPTNEQTSKSKREYFKATQSKLFFRLHWHSRRQVTNQ
jgi:hypothetical protein